MTGSDRGSRGRLRSLSVVDEAMEEEPEDNLNEGAWGKGVCILCLYLYFPLFGVWTNKTNSAVVGGGSIDKGTRQQTGFEGLKEAQRWRCSNRSKEEVTLAVYQISYFVQANPGVYWQGYDPCGVWVWVGPWHPGVYPCPSLFVAHCTCLSSVALNQLR